MQYREWVWKVDLMAARLPRGNRAMVSPPI